MTGVDILATEEVVINTTFNWNIYWVATATILVVTLVIGAIAGLIENDPSVFVIVLCFGMISAPLVSLIPGFVNGTPIEYETQYKVTVSDEVSMTEFHEKYEIIETEGKIYTVREKQNEEK